MSLLEQLLGANNGAAIDQVSRQFGLDPAQAKSAMDALLPTVAAGFQRSASAGTGTGLEGPTPVEHGNDVLGQIFGSKDVSRAVAQSAAANSGLDPALLRKMLPMLAMLVAGYAARQPGGGMRASGQADSRPGGGLGGLLGGLLGGSQPAASGGSGFGSLGGLAAMLDTNGDGNPLDDILRMANSMRR